MEKNEIVLHCLAGLLQSPVQWDAVDAPFMLSIDPPLLPPRECVAINWTIEQVSAHNRIAIAHTKTSCHGETKHSHPSTWKDTQASDWAIHLEQQFGTQANTKEVCGVQYFLIAPFDLGYWISFKKSWWRALDDDDDGQEGNDTTQLFSNTQSQPKLNGSGHCQAKTDRPNDRTRGRHST